MCAECDLVAAQLHAQLHHEEWNPVLCHPFGIHIYERQGQSAWHTTAHPPMEEWVDLGLEPNTRWETSGTVATTQRRAPHELTLRYRFYSVGFGPQRDHQAPPHERLNELVLPSPPGEAPQLQAERKALQQYAVDAFAFCAHSSAWTAIEAHARKCRQRHRVPYLWRNQLCMSTDQVQTDPDRFYWWFLSPQCLMKAKHSSTG